MVNDVTTKYASNVDRILTGYTLHPTHSICTIYIAIYHCRDRVVLCIYLIWLVDHGYSHKQCDTLYNIGTRINWSWHVRLASKYHRYTGSFAVVAYMQ